MVVTHNQQNDGEFGVHPPIARALAANAIPQPQPQPQRQAGTARMVVNRSSLRAISSKRSRSATESGATMAKLTKMRGR